MVGRSRFNDQRRIIEIESEAGPNCSKSDHQGNDVPSSVGVNWSISCQDEDVSGKPVGAQLRHSLPRLVCDDVSAR